MRAARRLVLCVVVLLAAGALAAASSSATPFYFSCVKTTLGHGDFSGESCSTAATGGSYEAVPFDSSSEPPPPRYKLVIGKTNFYAFTSGHVVAGEVSCLKGKGEGEVTTPTNGALTEKFEGCTSSGQRCNSPGQSAGIIKTRELETELAEDGSNVDLRVGVGEGLGNPVLEATCGTTEIVTTGIADAVLSGDIDAAKSPVHLAYSVNGTDEQENTVDGDELATEIRGVGSYRASQQSNLTDNKFAVGVVFEKEGKNYPFQPAFDVPGTFGGAFTCKFNLEDPFKAGQKCRVKFGNHESEKGGDRDLVVKEVTFFQQQTTKVDKWIAGENFFKKTANPGECKVGVVLEAEGGACQVEIEYAAEPPELISGEVRGFVDVVVAVSGEAATKFSARALFKIGDDPD
jgi:hypothetical protein